MDGVKTLYAVAMKIFACPFWTRVKAKIEETVNDETIRKLLNAGTKASLKNFNILFSDWLSQRFFIYNRDEINFYHAVYGSIFTQTKRQIIIDSSKDPVYAYILSKIEDFEVYVIHLVPDPRSSYYSFWKENKKSYILRWPFIQLISKLLQFKLKNKYKLVKYEEFTEDPESVLKDILLFVDEVAKATLKNKSVFFRPAHSLSGNPNRFQFGETRIINDEKWKKFLPFHRKAMVGITILPMKYLLKL